MASQWFQVRERKTARRQWCKRNGEQWVVWLGTRYDLPQDMTTEEIAHCFEAVRENGKVRCATVVEAGQLATQYSLVWE